MSVGPFVFCQTRFFTEALRRHGGVYYPNTIAQAYFFRHTAIVMGICLDADSSKEKRYR
ncbi:hypothetical protein Ccur_04970 [Cryptobacterium curtum DSM 15641]|uniref:Uncharacterized protein n=1 Tax=Cryptobacterium curtum (strain ATCC 700683 / DSM 15641 / CCUG 43107 / 12-3) TaxID=469378 RepID=C7MMS8_CRYCD|nr:hypothetical protein Ccur_04970 [Cryptobacterium curtum DSM 15641]